MAKKPFQPYDVINEETGRRVSIMSEDESQLPLAEGWSVLKTPEDGFRPRRKRTKTGMKQLIEDGVVADPSAPQPHQTYGEHVRVFEMPVATLSGETKQP